MTHSFRMSTNVKLTSCSSGGWELVYDYLTHITGEKGDFSGVPMHVGHYRDAMEARIQRTNPGAGKFFSARKWRVFLHSALALRMASMSPATRGPCCDLRIIGGDGTGIGIPLKNFEIVPAWAPLQLASSSSRQSRGSTMNRCAISPTDLRSSPSDLQKAREYLKKITCRTTSVNERGDLRDSIDDHATHMPPPIFRALEVFLILDETDLHWKEVRSILSALSHTDSLTGIVTIHMLDDVFRLVNHMGIRPPQFPDGVLIERISQQGMGPEIGHIFKVEMTQLCTHQSRCPQSITAFANLFEYIGNDPDMNILDL